MINKLLRPKDAMKIVRNARKLNRDKVNSQKSDYPAIAFERTPMANTEHFVAQFENKCFCPAAENPAAEIKDYGKENPCSRCGGFK